MGEHTSLQDRLGWVTGMIGEGSPHQLEAAQQFIDSLSESGYTTWLRIICEVQERQMFAGPEFTDYDQAQWLTLPQHTKDILCLAADVITGNRLTRSQMKLLKELQTEQELETFPDLGDQEERKLLAELWLAKAWDEAKPILPTEKPRKQGPEPPAIVKGTKYEDSPRHWPKDRKTGWGLG